MPFSGGFYTRVYSWVTDRLNSIPITDTRMDQEFDGIADALSNCVLKDGTQTITADIPMASHKFTGLSDGSAPGDSIHYGQLGDVITSSGTITTQAFGNIAISNDFQWSEIYLDGLIPFTNGANINMFISTDGGSTFLTANNYFYALPGQNANTGDAAASFGQAAGQIRLMTSASNSVASSAIIRIPNPAGSGRKPMHISMGFRTSAGDWIGLIGTAGYDTNDDITHVQIAPSTGTITFNYRVRGLR